MKIMASNNCKLIVICGEVKNVGFRRHVWRYANVYGLRGFIVNVDNSDCVASYVEGDPNKIDEFRKSVENLIAKYNVNKYQFIDLEQCIKLPANLNSFEIHGCLSDLLAEKIPENIVKDIEMKCVDYTI